MNIENQSKQEKDEMLKKDFKFAQLMYIGIYLTLVVLLVVSAYTYMDLTTYIIGNIILIALLYWVVKNKDN